MNGRRSTRWPVVLECGHDALVTSGSLYGGFGMCRTCPAGETIWARSRRIVRRYTLT